MMRHNWWRLSATFPMWRDGRNPCNSCWRKQDICIQSSTKLHTPGEASHCFCYNILQRCWANLKNVVYLVIILHILSNDFHMIYCTYICDTMCIIIIQGSYTYPLKKKKTLLRPFVNAKTEYKFIVIILNKNILHLEFWKKSNIYNHICVKICPWALLSNPNVERGSISSESSFS